MTVFYHQANGIEAQCGRALQHTGTQHALPLAVQCTANRAGKLVVASLFCVGVQRGGWNSLHLRNSKRF